MRAITEVLLIIGSILLWVVVLPVAGLFAGGRAISQEFRGLPAH